MMNTITSQVTGILEDKKKFLHESQEFIEIIGFIEEIKTLGLDKRQEYSLPPVDTLGRGFYEIRLRQQYFAE